MDVQGVNAQLYMSPREAAQMLGTRLDAVYSLIWAGRLQAEKRDGRWLVSQSEVEGRARSKTQRKVRCAGHGGGLSGAGSEVLSSREPVAV
jgi:excisionase family DNA binding protein